MDATSLATLWAMIALFIFFGIVIYLKVPGMITKSLDERATKIKNELGEAHRLRQEAQMLLAEYQKRRAEAEAKRKQIEGELEKKLADAEARIGQIKSAALKEVGAIAESTASAIIERLVGKADKADVAAAVKSAWR